MKHKHQQRNKLTSKNKEQTLIEQLEEYSKVPHSMVFCSGKVGKIAKLLMHDLRKLMKPFTASNLVMQKRNCLKDCLSIAGVMNVTNMVVLSKSKDSMTLRVMRCPRGPTLYFRIKSYSLSSDVTRSQKRPYYSPHQFQNSPLLILNQFSGEAKQLKLVATMFQNMFPSINVNQVKLDDLKRCVLLHYDKETDLMEFRHYNIQVVPVGLSRGIGKLLKKKVPNLSKFKDISELVTRSGELSESEAEQDEESEIILPQEIKQKGNKAGEKSAIRLCEIGPRLCLELFKVENGFSEGEAIYHKFYNKTQEEKAAQEKRRATKRKLKAKRKMEQNENVKRKEQLKAEHKEKSLKGMKNREVEQEVSDDDDQQYFVEEVGQAPSKDDLIPQKSSSSNKRKLFSKDQVVKRKKNEKKAKEENESREPAKSKAQLFLEDRLKRIKRRQKLKVGKSGKKGRSHEKCRVKETERKFTNKNKKTKRR